MDTKILELGQGTGQQTDLSFLCQGEFPLARLLLRKGFETNRLAAPRRFRGYPSRTVFSTQCFVSVAAHLPS
jgi:hypothetical protein